ncbi:MAG: HEAT repeat domain-containing protein [Phycisphaerales bacterium]|nr:MAG: HEAT repeat domain-containing protein [Phycisphaerales bacterium]
MTRSPRHRRIVPTPWRAARWALIGLTAAGAALGAGCAGGAGGADRLAYADPVARSAMRERAIAMLVDATASPDAMARANAIEGLQPAPGRVVPLAIAALNDPNLGVRFVAAMTLGELRAQEATEALRPLLRDASPMVQAAAIFAMTRVGASVDPTPLGTMLRSSDPRVRSNAAFVLGKIGNASAVPMLRAVADEPAPLGVRAEDKLFRLQVAEALVRLGRTDAIHAVRAALYPSEQDGVEAAVLAAQIIGQLEDRRSVAVLVTRINDRVSAGREYLMPAEMRLAASLALARMGYRDGAYVADEHAESPDPVLRSQAAFVYGETVRVNELWKLERMLSDPEEMVRVSAAASALRAMERLDTGN